ncbi:MAG: diguanylate cyclase domain-containing protein [Candidatus Izemoplasmatales bacterium]
MKTKVFLREEEKLVEVNITDKDKPDIDASIKERWQKVISIVADVLGVPSGLVMKITEDNMEVFLKSDNKDNPYPENGKDHLRHGLYCETVIGRDKALHVENALESHVWKDNPDVKLNMISYYGLPLKWGDGRVFGTICALDKKGNPFEKKYRDLLYTFKEMMEQDLMLLEEKQTLESLSGRDFLTNIANRRIFNNLILDYYETYKKSGEKFSLVMMDIDQFKYINDKYGHVTGDRILKRFAQVMKNNISDGSLLARYGGDEFVLLSKKTQEKDITEMMDQLKAKLQDDDFLKQYHVDISYGTAIIDEDIDGIERLIEMADINLYKQKNFKNKFLYK